MFGVERAAAQASPFIPTDHPAMPLVEHLIARGAIRDPSPLMRPLRRTDLMAALATTDDRLAARLARALASPGEHWQVVGRGGLQGFSQGRQDLLRPGGSEGAIRGYGELGGWVVSGPLIIAARGAAENRLKGDPEWPEPERIADQSLVLRAIEGYAGLQHRWIVVHAGQLARNWGPVGFPGTAISDAGYPRPDLGVTLGLEAVRYDALATRLQDVEVEGGEPIQRYLVQHRLTLRPAGSLSIAAWEAAVIAGPAAELDGVTKAVVPLLIYPAVYASQFHRNEMVGLSLSWRVRRGIRIEAELAIDDWNFGDNPYPQRWAATVTGAGALGPRASWIAGYATVSSLALRTFRPEESWVDRGVGIGRLFPDNEQAFLSVGIPVRGTWLISPKLALLRQGEGRINAPFPPPEEAATTPARFIGTIARTGWAGASLAGLGGPLDVQVEAGVRHTRNAEHQDGRTRTSVEARVMAALSFRLPAGRAEPR
ncbi:MAG: hypothetical protein ACT4PM_09470 [Gemmatimonadales bacterium]